MRGQIAAFIERALPRGFSAGLMLLLAILTSPAVVGIYAYVILMYTAIQAVTDLAARQVLMRVVREPGGEQFYKTYRRIAPTVAFLLIIGVIVLLRVRGVVDTWLLAAELSPVALAPAATAMGLIYVGRLQSVGRWHVTARVQLVAVLVSFSITLPILILTRSLLGPALQVLMSEVIVAVLCRRASRELHIEKQPAPPGSRSLKADMLSMSAYSITAWFQGQAERVLFGIFIGPASLGTYSTASAIARAPGDALAASTANVLRSDVAELHEHRDIQRAAEATLKKAMLLAGAGFATAVTLSLILRPLMDAEWDKALVIVPVLALTAFPSVLAWSASVLQLRSGKAWQALWAPIAGIAMAVVIAIVATKSLLLASYVVVLRDFATVTIAFLFIPRSAPWRAYSICWAIVIVLGTAIYFVTK